MYVYILTNYYNRVLYVGVTNNLTRRTVEHEMKIHKGYTYRYNATKLVYFEEVEGATAAIAREKSLKGKRRDKKIALIASMNPEWQDLFVLLEGQKPSP